MDIILIILLILIIFLLIDMFCKKKENFVISNRTNNYIMEAKESSKELAALIDTINTNYKSFITSSKEFIKIPTQQNNLTNNIIPSMNYWIPEVVKYINNINNSTNEIPLSPQVKQILLNLDIVLNKIKEADRNGLYYFINSVAPTYLTLIKEYNNKDMILYITNIFNATKTLSTILANLKDNIFNNIKLSIKQYVFTNNIYKKENIENAVKNGEYDKIENDVFNLNNESSYWQLTVVFKYIPNYYSIKQGIIGNMYNNYVNNIGWGLWVENNILNWSESNNTQQIGTYQYNVLFHGYTYKLVLTFENNKYLSQLTTLEGNMTRNLIFEKKSQLITDTGFVTIGGLWENKPEEKFKGEIISIQLIPTKVAAEKTVTQKPIQTPTQEPIQTTGIQSKPFYIVENPQGIKSGNYKNISNNIFGLNSNLTNWTITIMINSSNYSDSWQGIVGNMYNNSLWIGWGLWVNPNSVLHWRIVNSTWNLDNLGNLINNTPYKIVINFDNNNYKFTLTNLNTNTNNSQTIQNQSKLIADNGWITLGGFWTGLNGEQFNGTIDYLDFFTKPT